MNWVGILFLRSTATWVLLTATAEAAQPNSLAKLWPAKGPLRVHAKNPLDFTDGTKAPDGSLKTV
jgi:hypothetical protein